MERKTDLDPEDWSVLKSLGNRIVDDMLDFLEHIRDNKVWTSMPPEVRVSFLQHSPDEGIDASNIYAEVRENIIKYGSGNVHPRFMGWVQGGGTPAAVLADIIASGMNMNCGGRDHVGIALEQQVVRWVAEWFGYDRDIAKGLFVTGSSMASFMGVLVAKQHLMSALREKRQTTPQPLVGFRVYTSAGAHKCIAQAVKNAGMDFPFELAALSSSGEDLSSLRRIPVDEQYRMRLDKLEEAITEDRAKGWVPMMVVATVGTVDVGAVDDLEGISAIARRENLWMHIDGAYGALAILAPTVRPLLVGMDKADSIAFDFHKWGQVQYDAGMLIVREGGRMKDTFSSQTAAYLSRADRGMLGGDFWPCDYGPDLSRSCRAMKVWFSVKAHGTSNMGQVMDNGCRLARELGSRAEREETLELMAPVTLNIVCFRFTGLINTLSSEDMDKLNCEIVTRLHEEGTVAPSLTTLSGQKAIRAGLFNHRTTMVDVECLVDTVLRVGQQLMAEGFV